MLDTDEFARESEPETPPLPESKDADEIREMFAELEQMEAVHAAMR